jgi:hypothetical protein
MLKNSAQEVHVKEKAIFVGKPYLPFLFFPFFFAFFIPFFFFFEYHRLSPPRFRV